jgi:hypothetical protein
MARLLSIAFAFLVIASYAQDLTKLEYFIDTDPGHGNGTAVTITPGATLTDATFDVPLTSLPLGIHNIFFRIQDEDLTWGQTYKTLIYKESIVLDEELEDFVKAEFFIDTDPGFGQGVDIPVPAQGTLTNFTFAVPLNTVSGGLHIAYVRLKNANGQWSHTFSRVIYKELTLTSDPPPDIVKAEYFIDADPGFGSGTDVPLTPGATVTDLDIAVPVSSLQPGIHAVYVRVQTENLTWSQTLRTIIYKETVIIGDPAPDIAKVEYFIDDDPGFGNGTNVPITPGTITDLSFTADLTTLSNGVHILYTRIKDENGTWSSTYKSILFKENISSLSLPDITKMEFFVNTDPGYGNGIDIPVTPGSVVTDVNFAVDITGLPEGNHKVYIRGKDANNHWSIVHVESISVCQHPGTTLNAATNITATAFDLSWGVVPSSSGYQLDVSTDNFKTFVSGYNAKSIPSNTTSVTGVTHATDYQVRVRAVASCASVHSNVIDVTTPLSAPSSQPSSLQFNLITTSSYTVQYNAASGPPTGYLVVRKEGSSPAFVPQANTEYTLAEVLSDGIVAYVGPDLTFPETGLTSNTQYFYDIFSFNQADGFTAYRTTSPLEGSVRTVAIQPTAQPTNLEFSTITDTGLEASFTPPAGGADGYIVLRQVDTAPVAAPVDGTTYTTVVGSNTVAYQGADPFFTQTGLTENTHYFYAVFAFNGAGAGINYVELSPLMGDVTTPISPPSSQPTNLVFANVNTTTVDVSFTATSADGYLVIRKDGSSPTFVPQANDVYDVDEIVGDGVVVSVGASTSFQETGLTAETTYYYDVFAYNETGALIGYRGFSPLEGSVTTLVEPPTAAPTGLTLSGISSTTIDLSFVPSASSTSTLVLRKAGSASTFVPVDGTPYALDEDVSDVTVVYNGSGNSFTDDGLSPGIVYHYHAFAYNGSGGSSSYFDTPDSDFAITIPGIPVLINPDPVSQTGFTVSWNAVTGADEYRIDVSADDFATMVVDFDDAVVASNFVVVTGLQPGIEYKYRVRSVNDGGTSADSGIGAQFTVPATPQLTVIDPEADPIGQTGFTIRWSEEVGVLHYEVDVSTDDFSSFVSGYEAFEVAEELLVLTGLTPGVEYQYRARSVNSGGGSPNSDPLSQLTIPGTPQDLDATITTSTSFKAEWEAVPNVTEYRIDVTLAGPTEFDPPLAAYDDRPVTEPEILITQLTPSKAYKYRVRAVNAAGASPNSATFTWSTTDGAGGVKLTNLQFPEKFAGNTATVTVQLDDGASPYLVTLFHRKISGDEYTQVTSTVEGESTFSGTLSLDMADELGVEFYISVQDNNGETKDTRALRNPIGPAIIRRAIAATGLKILSAGGGTKNSYQIFSIPYKLDDDDIGNIFEELGERDKEKWRLLRYQDGANVDFGGGLTKIELGKGYWLNSKDPVEISYSGGHAAEVSENAPFTMSLERGWNQIGDPFPFDVDWDDILGLPANTAVADVLSIEITTFNASDAKLDGKSDVLKTGGGGFVHNSSPASVDLILPVSLKNSAGRKKSDRWIENAIIDKDQWLVPIAANIGGVSSHAMSVGMHPKALPSMDKYDDVVVPRFIDYVEMYSYHEEFFTPKFSRDVVPTVSAKSWDLTFESNVGENVDLSWPSHELGNGPARLFLVDLSAGRWVDMKASNSYSFKANGPHKMKVVYGLTEEDVDLGVNLLGTPYPNPFEGQLTIPFVVYQAPAQIDIAIYDMLGRKVAQPVNAILGRGMHEASWDGMSADKSNLPPGIYFCRMSGGAMTMTERIIKK